MLRLASSTTGAPAELLAKWDQGVGTNSTSSHGCTASTAGHSRPAVTETFRSDPSCAGPRSSVGKERNGEKMDPLPGVCNTSRPHAVTSVQAHARLPSARATSSSWRARKVRRRQIDVRRLEGSPLSVSALTLGWPVTRRRPCP